MHKFSIITAAQGSLATVLPQLEYWFHIDGRAKIWCMCRMKNARSMTAPTQHNSARGVGNDLPRRFCIALPSASQPCTFPSSLPSQSISGYSPVSVRILVWRRRPCQDLYVQDENARSMNVLHRHNSARSVGNDLANTPVSASALGQPGTFPSSLPSQSLLATVLPQLGIILVRHRRSQDLVHVQ
jgi:hypothetical protein